MNKITATIITLNEEKNIESCILSIIHVVDEVIVLDSGSTDNTCQIAKSLGAKVFSHEYLGNGFQRNLADSYARNDWIFALDADEQASPQLQEMLALTNLKDGHAYSFKRKNHVSTRWIKFGDAYPDRVIRLYQKSVHSYNNVIEHGTVISNHIVSSDQDLLHFGTKSIADMYEKSIKFAKRSAKDLYKRNIKPKNPFISGVWLFLRLYIFKFGFLGIYHYFRM
jgi:glycosyltransferase involved in cell wall biosynthesis